MRKTAQRLTFRAMTVRKYFRNKNPDDRSLSDGVRGDKGEDANRNDRKMSVKKAQATIPSEAM
jgi:hypothetical protein